MTSDLQVGLHTTIYKIESQAIHQHMPIHEIEIPLAQHDSDYDHTWIFDYLWHQTHLQP